MKKKREKSFYFSEKENIFLFLEKNLSISFIETSCANNVL